MVVAVCCEILLIVQHFGGQVVQRAAESFSAVGGGVDGPAEIGDFDGVSAYQ